MNQTDNHAVARAVHDLGSALWFGGTVMGVAGWRRQKGFGSVGALKVGITEVCAAASAFAAYSGARIAKAAEEAELR